MANGYAILMAADKVSTSHYHPQQRWPAAPTSLDYFKQMLLDRDPSFQIKTLNDGETEVEKFKTHLKNIAQKLQSGDLLVLSFWGHGASFDGFEGDPARKGSEEGWCMFDRVLFFFELWELAYDLKIPKGVRIVIISDSCYSGGFGLGGHEWLEYPVDGDIRTVSVFERNKAEYQKVFTGRGILQHQVQPAVLALSAVPEDTQTHFGSKYTDFTRHIRFAIKKGGEYQDYREFYAWLVKQAAEPAASPVWHYYQGHKLTWLPAQPIFSI